MAKKALVLSSGGVDSTTALAMAVSEYGAENVTALSVYYGQKHAKEIEAAKKIADFYGVRRLELDLTDMFRFSDCSLLSRNPDSEIPKESYGEQVGKTDGAPVSTYVPFRNGLFLSAAAAYAISLGASEILYGAHSDDSAGSAYPDCSAVFNDAMNTAIYEGSGRQVKIRAPFVGISKKDVVAIGVKLGVPYELTWSCYEGGDKPCGACGTCRDRKAAFEANGLNLD